MINENTFKYFEEFPPGHSENEFRLIPLDRLIKTKGAAEAAGVHPSPVDKALNHITDLANGVAGAKRRAPITVHDNGDGTFAIDDGNATHEAAVRLGWKVLPVQILRAHVISISEMEK